MKTMTKLLASGALALSALAATAPATAQVSGNIATADVSRAIIGTTAFQTAYQQINTTYAAQIEQGRTLQQQVETAVRAADTNGDGQLDEAEQAALRNSPQLGQIESIENQIAALQQQVNFARIFAVEQILLQYPAALTSVTQQQQIVLVFPRDTVQFAAEGANITAQISSALNTRIPSVQIVPPEGYVPSRDGAQIFQEIQAILISAQRQQAAQAAQQQQQQPATQAPSGR